VKIKLQTLFFFLLVTQICYGQWYQQNSGTTQNLRALHFVNENNGWAVGDCGIILHTSNAGATWDQQTIGTISLNDVFFTDENKGWIVGSGENILLHTTNGGVDWMQQIQDSILSFYSLYFIDENTGWVVGGVRHPDTLASVILKTTNSGMNWILQSSPAVWPINDICFINNDVGYAVEGATVVEWAALGATLKTTDGGETWIKLTADTTVRWDRVSFLDTQNGIIAGVKLDVFGNFPRVFYTADGGINWMESNRGYEGYFTSLVIVDSIHAWASGSPYALARGAILFSSDKGAIWSIQTDYSYSLNNVFFINSSTGWAVGDSGKILHTTNGGVSFVEEEQIDEMPTEFLLTQNYPNPFNPSTRIKYSIPPVGTKRTVSVQIKVFDVLGNEIATLVDEYKPAGTYEVTWYATDLSSGVYFYLLKAGEYTAVKKMILIK
jgi:photosystem II stability/assembly factor-like uncharacterized protein